MERLWLLRGLDRRAVVFLSSFRFVVLLVELKVGSRGNKRIRGCSIIHNVSFE